MKLNSSCDSSLLVAILANLLFALFLFGVLIINTIESIAKFPAKEISQNPGTNANNMKTGKIILYSFIDLLSIFILLTK